MKILIVDDEPKIRKHLHDLIRHACDGYEVVGEAENGAEAIALLARTHVDIVITDIRMPGMDGLALLAEIARLQYVVGRVILSGYDDFAYTQPAMRQGVQNYLLKPVAPDELRAALQRAEDELLHARMLDRQLRKGEIACRERWLLSLLYGMEPKNALAEGKTFGLSISFEHCTLFLIDLAEEKESEEPRPNEWEKQWQSNTSVLAIAERTRVAILWQSDEPPEESARMLLQRLKADHPRALVAYSDPIVSPGDTRSQYLRLKQLLDNRWLVQGSDVLSARQWFDDAWISVGEWKYDVLDAAVEHANEHEIRQQINLFFTTLENRAPHVVRALFTESVVHSMRVIFDKGGNVYDVLGEQLNLNDLLSRMSFGELREWYIQLCMRIGNYLAKIRAKRPKRVSEQVLALFYEDCAHDYSLDKLASIFYMSAAYLSEVFKKETGKTVHACLTEIRIERSCQLLRDTDDAVYEIAEQAGYPNLRSYFTAFKKYMGCTPGQYREGGI